MTDTTYTTKDFVTAAYCYVHGCRIVGTSRVGDTVWITFDDRNGQCEALTQDIQKGQDMVSASLFHEHSRRLKKLIYAA
jgi:hypothetical protein